MTTHATGPFSPPIIVAPNPLPASIDWDLVSSVLGVRILQGAPQSDAEAAPRSVISDALTEVVSLAADRTQRNAAARAGFDDPELHQLWLALEQLRRGRGLQLEDRLLSFGDLSEREREVLEAFADLVEGRVRRSALDLTGLNPSHVGLEDRVQVGHDNSPSSVVGASEGTAPAGSASADSAGDPFGPRLATADDVVAGRARYADTPGGHADRRTLRAEGDES